MSISNEKHRSDHQSARGRRLRVNGGYCGHPILARAPSSAAVGKAMLWVMVVDDDVRESGFHSYLDDSVRSRPAPDEEDLKAISTRLSKSPSRSSKQS